MVRCSRACGGFLWVAGSLVLLGGCPPQAGPDPNSEPNEPNLSSQAVSFAVDIEPILSTICADCHRPGGFAASQVDMDLRAGSAYASIVAVASDEASGRVRIIPGNPDGSYLVEKISSDQPQVGARMPLGGEPLTDEQITLIRAWVSDGAPNN